MVPIDNVGSFEDKIRSHGWDQGAIIPDGKFHAEILEHLTRGLNHDG